MDTFNYIFIAIVGLISFGLLAITARKLWSIVKLFKRRKNLPLIKRKQLRCYFIGATADSLLEATLWALMSVFALLLCAVPLHKGGELMFCWALAFIGILFLGAIKDISQDIKKLLKRRAALRPAAQKRLRGYFYWKIQEITLGIQIALAIIAFLIGLALS